MSRAQKTLSTRLRNFHWEEYPRQGRQRRHGYLVANRGDKASEAHYSVETARVVQAGVVSSAGIVRNATHRTVVAAKRWCENVLRGAR